MSVVPQQLVDAAGDVEKLGICVEEANSAAVRSITSILPAGADQVSAAISQLFTSHGQWYQGMAAQAQKFHTAFAQTMAVSGNTYHDAEVLCAEELLWNAVGQLEQPLIPLIELAGLEPAPPVPTVSTNLNPIGLIMGPTDLPVLSQPLANAIGSIYGIANPTALFTPEQAWPLTPQLGNLTFGQSVAQGNQLLSQAISDELAAGNHTTVWGSSQSSLLITHELRSLMAQGSPGQGLLTFILTGDPANPNGGLWERFPGLYVPVLDMLFSGATPPDAPYPVSIFNNEYSFFGDFPRYPLNLVSDANAFVGLAFGVHNYGPPTNLSDYQLLPTSPGYTGSTQYFMAPTPDLPLLEPFRHYGGLYGNTLADLLQPDLRVVVDMGYGSGEYANLVTPASLLELPNPTAILSDLATGAVQGPTAALVDLGVLPQSMYPTTYPFVPVLDPGLNYPLPQTGVSGLALLSGSEGQLMRTLGLIPPWDAEN
ncbi:hypothetical protein A5706_22105 [Mycobacterium sp. E796]|nr:hypothetical protein A5706_22105 [Mycobacterium sp. E796]